MAMATTLLTSPQYGEPGRDRPTIGHQGIGGALSLFARRYHEECRKVNAKVCPNLPTAKSFYVNLRTVP